MDSLSSVIDTTQLSAEVLQLMGYLQGNLPWILVLVASAAVMQLITTIILLTSRKRGRGYRYGNDRRPGASGEGKQENKGQGGAQRRNDGGNAGGGQRKPGGDNRGGGGQRQGGGQQGGRPQQERGGRPNQSSIDPMEMSLRDINQRLKNAEREQDNARKNLRDSDGADGDGRGSRDNRQQQQRGGRDGGGRDGRGGNRDDRGPRRDNRDNRDNRNGGRPERQDRNDGQRQQQEHGRFRREEQNVESTERPQAPEIVQNDMGAPEDQPQHGRRFTAKRRVLPDDPVTPSDEGQQQYRSNPEENAPSQTNYSEEQGGTENIQFGR